MGKPRSRLAEWNIRVRTPAEHTGMLMDCLAFKKLTAQELFKKCWQDFLVECKKDPDCLEAQVGAYKELRSWEDLKEYEYDNYGAQDPSEEQADPVDN